MRYAIIIVAVLSVMLLMAGCGRKIAPPKEAPKEEVPSTPAAAAEDTTAAASEIEKAIGQAGTEDLDLTTTDTLDQDLADLETLELG